MGEPGGQAGSRRMQAGEPHTLATTVPGAGASPTPPRQTPPRAPTGPAAQAGALLHCA